MTKIESCVSLLEKCYRNQLVEYRSFLAISQQLHHNVSNDGDAAELSRYLEQQNEIITTINTLDYEAQNLKTDIAELMSIENFTLSKLVETNVSGITELSETLNLLTATLFEIEKVEKENQALLEKRLSLLKTEANQLQSGKTAFNTYRGTNKIAQSRFIDKKR